MKVENHTGHGGSYSIDNDGSVTLNERTKDVSEQAPTARPADGPAPAATAEAEVRDEHGA